jgi:hypothetical protein
MKSNRGIRGALWAHACSVHTSRKPSCFVGQPILAAAGFQPALFACAPAGFCRKRRSRRGSSVARVNALHPSPPPRVKHSHASTPLTRIALYLLCCASAAASIDGVVVNRSTGQPQPGVSVTVSKMSAETGMLSNNAGNAKTDAQGKFAFTASVDGPTLLRATWDGVTYSHMLPPGTPSSGLAIDVYNSSKNPGAAKVSKHMLLFEPGAGQMTVNETFLLSNDGQATWNDPKDGTLHFFLPATHSKFQIHATAPGSVDVPATAAKSPKPDIYQVDFAIKPGETRFDLTYNVPYAMGSQYEGKIVTKDDNTYLIVPDGVTLTAGNLTDLGQEPRTKAHIFGLPGTAYNIQLTGAEVATADAAPDAASATPDASAGPEIEATMPRVFGEVKPILAIALGILGLGFALLYRKEASGAVIDRSRSGAAQGIGLTTKIKLWKKK